MAIKVIAQLPDVKLGKNPGKKFVMRPDLYVPITEKKVFQRYLRWCDQGGLGCCWRSDPHLGDRRSLYPTPRSWHDALRRALEGGGEAGGCEGRAEEHLYPDYLSRRGRQRAEASDFGRLWRY